MVDVLNKLISGYALVHVQYIVTDPLIMHKGVSHVIYGVHLNSWDIILNDALD